MPAQPRHPHAPPLTRRERFLASYIWLILKNIIGWVLILASFIAGPFVPGPGGIPMFLLGFALITFPGKRRLVARLLRGRSVWFWSVRISLITLAWSIAVAGLVLWIFGSRWDWLAEAFRRGPLTILSAYVFIAVMVWLITSAALAGANIIIRWMPRMRRRVRPWLRRHHIRLLPPRWRTRHPHEHGSGPMRLKDEIVAILKKRSRARHDG
ncbi:MAG: hypothetical protein L0219_10075 [Phycisphaerales bacterium]|nr:hypothetical protein [Phycisphaerales bacterium]